jgi:hypothetical protein
VALFQHKDELLAVVKMEGGKLKTINVQYLSVDSEKTA